MSVIYYKNGQKKELAGTTPKSDLLDMFYPVGSYYETSDYSFDPNVSWGGTWVEDTRGLVTSGAYREGTGRPGDDRLYLNVGNIEGSIQHYHLTTWGWYNGTAGARYKVTNTDWGASNTHKVKVEYGNWRNVNMDQAQSENEATQDATDWGSTVQPTIGVFRWHRTA